MVLCLFKKVQPFGKIHLHEKPGTEPETTAEEKSISFSPVSHINGIITEIDKKG